MICKSAEDFLAKLRELDVRLALENERLTCSAPKGVLTADLKAELVRRKPEIIELLRSLTPEKPVSQEIFPICRTGALPLSPAQQRLWFLAQYESANPAYVIPGTLHIRGALNREALEATLRKIVDRHEVLRTAYLNIDGEPRAVIGNTGAWNVRFQVIDGAGEQQRQSALLRELRREAQTPIDLSAPPLLRATLFQVNPLEHVLELCVHHIALDGWSLSLLTNELEALYRDYANGREPSLPAPDIQFVDYVAWQSKAQDSGSNAKQMSWWKRQLAAPLAVIDLPSDHPRPPVLTSNGCRLQLHFPQELRHHLAGFAQQSGATSFMVLLAAFKILLHRYTGETDIAVGSAVAGRNHPQLERMLGLFINTLVLRTKLANDLTATDVIDRVRETTLNSFAHAEVPFDELVSALQPTRQLDRTPLFQVMFTFQNFPHRQMNIEGLEISPMHFDTGLSRFDLTVETIDYDGELVASYEFNTDLFEPATIERFHDHYVHLLADMMADPQRPISSLCMMSTAERQTLIESAMPDRTTDLPATCIHDLIAATARRAPDRTAVTCEDVHVSYGELVRQSDRLAAHLQASGVGPGSIVGVALNRTELMPVALLGVLKSGAAYVPLDPQYPPERIAYMLEDSAAAVVVTETQLAATLPAGTCQLICLDSLLATTDESVPEPRSTASSDDVAYVIYTSGSTGKPKGVQVTHGALVNFLLSMQREPGITAGDRLLAVTTLCFDIAGLEMYLPLLAGAELVIAPRRVTTDPVALAATIDRERISILQATPATWRMLTENGWRNGSGLKALCGGEALPRDLAVTLLDAGCDLWNLYGPTETTIWSTVFHVEAPVGDSVPLGKPIANTSLYILDERGQLVPDGVPGELYIGGAGVARGYLNRPELTSQRFVNDPFAPGERIYRTGDLVRCRRNGTIEYLGRLDHQVKIRGFRIELGEIEAALAQQSGIRQAVVVAKGTGSDVRLVAYMTSDASGDKSPDRLRAALTQTLPDYMVPSAFVFLDSFPMTPNGKIDRKALPEPELRGASSAAYVPPRNDIEREVSEIWQHLLKLERAGIHDNFFDLGGHSLLVVQLQNRLRQQFAREMTLVELFQRPTIASIAACLEQSTALRSVAHT